MLAWPNEELMVGGFLGDFVKGPLRGDLPAPIESGVKLHRRIDAQSDRHESMLTIKSNLPNYWARYAGIVADLYCDHLISNPKSELLSTPPTDFADNCYQTLSKHQYLFSEKANWVFNRMRQGRWLERYGELEFTLASLERIGQRLKFDNPLMQSEQLILQYGNIFESHCPNLYAGMQKVVAEWHAEADTSKQMKMRS